MAESKKLQMVRIAYTNSNFQKVYELSDELILGSSSDIEVGIGWIFKGLSAGNLSNPNRERLKEAQSYFKEAEKAHADSTELLNGAKELSAIALSHVAQLKDFYTNASERKVKSQHGKVVHSSHEASGERIGRELGQVLFDSLHDTSR